MAHIEGAAEASSRARDDQATRKEEAANGGPSAAPVHDRAASRTADIGSVVVTALQRQLGLDSVAAQAIVSGLRRRGPDPEAFSVYLDLNHWISLAKAKAGHPDGTRFIPCLDLLLKSAGSGKLILPLGTTHYTEVRNITDVRQRADIANVMAELSGFTTLAARKYRLRCEVSQALHERLGRPMFPERLKPFGRGIAFAAGIGDGPAGRVTPVGGAAPRVSERYRAELEFRLNQAAEYLLLRGPSPEDLPHMPGYDVRAVQEIAEERAAREQQLFELLQASPASRERLSDIVPARALFWGLGPQLPELLALAGMSIDSFFHKGKEWLTSFLDAIPALAVPMSLVTQTDKNGSREWTRNDIYDMDALEAAVPYCDVVVTEKYACHVMNQSGLADRFSTTVIRRLDDLIPTLQSIA